MQSASAEVSRSSAEAEKEDSESAQQDPALQFGSDDVIAIEDLDKVIADPKVSEDNQP